MKLSKVSGKIVTATKINAYNDFGKKEEVTMTDFTNAKDVNGKIETVLPAKSVVLLQLQPIYIKLQ